MSDTASGLCRKIDSAEDLPSVVRTMKALAAASIGQYEKSVCGFTRGWRTPGCPLGLFAVPNSVKAITPLVGKILVASEERRRQGEVVEEYIFHNRPKSGAVYEPVNQRLLPLDDLWRIRIAGNPWPTANLPEIQGGYEETLRAFIREYLFVSLFRAGAESLASENASRLAAMQRADKNIEELLEDLKGAFHRKRQSGLDEELFDVLSGFEALGGEWQ